MLNRILRWLGKPWLHFLILGYALWRGGLWLYPPEPPVVGPLSAARIEALRVQWVSLARRVPSDEQMQHLVDAELDREMLYLEALSRDFHLYDTVVEQRLIRNMKFLRLDDGRDDETLYKEALKLELHLGDEVIKRRLQQLMETVLLAQTPIPAVTDSEMQALFEQEKEALRVPSRYSFQHVYLPEKREDELDDLLLRLRADNLEPSVARQFSAPFLPGLSFRGQSLEQVARNFGWDFSEGLENLEPKERVWQGPIASVYGSHLVWIEKYVPDRDAELSEVRPRLERQWMEERKREALASQIDTLRKQYEVRR